ncbi:MAG: DUF4153 domain-containing protein [Paracoccus sp. (in: a-proteobacteria)]
MQNVLTIRGVPRALERDAWWLCSTTDETGGDIGAGAGAPSRVDRIGFRAWQLLALVAIADLLFWVHAPGISVALFAGAIFGLASWDIRPRRVLIRPAALLLIGALPVVDYVQLLSVGFLAGALIVALVWVRMPQARPEALLAGTRRSLRALPLGWAAPFRFLGRLPGRGDGGETSTDIRRLRRLIGNWAFPIGGALILTALLMEANPVLARMFSVDLELETLFRRALFWTGTAFVFAPLLSLAPAPGRSDPAPSQRRICLPGLGINAGSVLRALIVFNLLLAVQIVTDLSILTGTASLPEDISLASYAHRGAYPLLVTALLAGAFALAARPFLGEHKLVRPLMLIWLGQNAALCVSAMLRLETYIEAYGMTYLRIYALIWMGVVAIGLGLTAWQMLRGHSNGWMLRRAAVLGLATLYLCSFVNFAQIIVAHNLTGHSPYDNVQPDLRYACRLGPMAAGPMAEARKRYPGLLGDGYLYGICGARRIPAINGWQEWGFRKARVNRYVDRVMAANGQAQ